MQHIPTAVAVATHRQKVERLVADLRKQGVSRHTVAPPLFRLLWALGLAVPPPLFLGPVTLTLLMGGFFGAVWGALMWLLLWHLPLGRVVASAALAGLIFGLLMAAYYRWKAAQLRLPPWGRYPGA
jgi:hypothetical protein